MRLSFLGEILQKEPRSQNPLHYCRLIEKHSSEAHLGTCYVVWLRHSVVSGNLSMLFLFYVKWPQAEGAQFTWLKGLQNDFCFCHLCASGLCSGDTCSQWKENWICILLFCFFVGLLVHDSKAIAETSEPKMQLYFSVTCCLARSNNSNYWAREKRIIQPALLQVFVEPYSWEVEDDFHSEQTFLWTSSISSSLCMCTC